MTDEKLGRTLEKVRKLIATAESYDDPASESYNPTAAQTYRAQADALMLKYAIDEATLAMSRPAEERGKPEILTVALTSDNDILGYVVWLVRKLAQHTRCQARMYTSFKDGAWQATVYGFASDLRYFEFLYTTLRLHMLGALTPGIDGSADLDENCYRLHSAGYNWLEIAQMYGWKAYAKMYGSECRAVQEAHPEVSEIKGAWVSRDLDVQPVTTVGGIYKRAYLRAVKARGEQPTKIAANGSSGYRISAAQGYIDKLDRRFRELEGKMTGSGAELVLASRAQDLEDFIREQNPSRYTRCPACGKLSDNRYTCDRCGAHLADPVECEACKKSKSGTCRAHKGRASKGRQVQLNHSAYRRGSAHADTADLGGPKVGNAPARPLGS